MSEVKDKKEISYKEDLRRILLDVAYILGFSKDGHVYETQYDCRHCETTRLLAKILKKYGFDESDHSKHDFSEIVKIM